MLSGKEISDLEQASKGTAEHIVPMLAEQFRAYLKEGFTREEALTMTRDFFKIVVTVGYLSRAPKTPPGAQPGQQPPPKG